MRNLLARPVYDVLCSLTKYDTREEGRTALGMQLNAYEHAMSQLVLHYGVTYACQAVHNAYLDGTLSSAEGLEERLKVRPKIAPKQCQVLHMLAATGDTRMVAIRLKVTVGFVKNNILDVRKKFVPIAGYGISRERLVHLMWHYGYFRLPSRAQV